MIIRTNETFLGQFKGESSGDLLQFVIRVFLGINLDTGFATAEGYIHTGALECHQSGQSFHLVTGDIHGETDTCRIPYLCYNIYDKTILLLMND